MIKLVLTDLDGTFLNKSGSFDQSYYEKVKTMMDQNNVIFAPCTGKQCERVEELFDTDISKNIWILGDSATRIKHEGKYIYESLLPNKLGLQIIEKLENIASDHIIIACTPTAAYIKSTVSKEDAQKIRKSYAVVKKQEDLQNIEEDFVKITVFDQKLRAFENVKELSEFEAQAYIVASEAAWIDISNYNVHKGTTVQALQHILGVTKEETIAFGDGLNDIELLEAAGCSFAVNNAFDIVKEKADFITKSNEEMMLPYKVDTILYNGEMNKMATSKRYDESFKQTIIELYDNGQSVSELQKEFGVATTTVYKWIDKYSKKSGQEFSKSDVLALKKENARLKEEANIDVTL